MERPLYLDWLIEEEGVILDNGELIKCYRIDYTANEAILDAWAVHIRRHYVSDEDLAENCEELEMTPAEYLKQNVISQRGEGMAGTARSNGISEILFMDLFEFINGFEVPRCKFDNMSGKTVSEHGVDVIGYKFYNKDRSPNQKDLLITVEVKSELTKTSTEVIRKAVIDAQKDEYRLAQSLEYMRRKLKRMNQRDKANDILRFLKKTEVEYVVEHYAAGISSIEDLNLKVIAGCNVKVIPEIIGEELRLKGDIGIYYVHGKRLMELAHKVYDRCVK